MLHMSCQRNSATGTLIAQWYSCNNQTARITLRNVDPSTNIAGGTTRLILVIGIQ